MIGILGGSFDPIHYGHLHIAQALHKQLHLSHIRFIPCKNASFGKKINASTPQRLNMLQRALEPYPYFIIDKRELERSTPSYTLDTLVSLRDELGKVPLGLILGIDNLENLNQWYQWLSLIHYAHLLIVPRTHQKIYNTDVARFVKKYQTHNSALLSQSPAGLLLMAKINPLAISATFIRNQIANGIQPRGLLPSAVLDYILKEKLYV